MWIWFEFHNSHGNIEFFVSWVVLLVVSGSGKVYQFLGMVNSKGRKVYQLSLWNL